VSGDNVTAQEVEGWYRVAASHLYHGMLYPTLWSTRIPHLEASWEGWLEDVRPELLEDDPRYEEAEMRLVAQGAFDEIVAFFCALPDDVRTSAVGAMRAEVASMRRGDFRPCVGLYEIEDLYEYKGGPIFEEAWAGIVELERAFICWAQAQHPRTFQEWAATWPADRREKYPDAALCDLENRVKAHSGASPMAEFHASLPFESAVTAAQALATFRRRHGG
jgi:hypothetical protein